MSRLNIQDGPIEIDFDAPIEDQMADTNDNVAALWSKYKNLTGENSVINEMIENYYTTNLNLSLGGVGPGTVNYIPKFNAPNSINDSIMRQAGAWIVVGGSLFVNTDIMIGNNRYIGSVDTPQAIQIEADGDVVLTDELYLADNNRTIYGDAADGTIRYVSATQTFHILLAENHAAAEMILETTNACSSIQLRPGGVETLTAIPNHITINAAATAGVDPSLTFAGATFTGIITWMQALDYFRYSDDILMNANEHIYFRDTALSINSAGDGRLDVNADVSIDLNQNVDVTGNVNVSGVYQIGGSTVLDVAGTNVTRIGVGAGVGSTGAHCVFVGTNAGGSVPSTGSSNTVMGVNTGDALSSGAANSLYGTGCGSKIDQGHRNSLYGAGCAANLVSGNDNCMFGESVGASVVSASNINLFGVDCGSSIINSTACNLFGTYCGDAITSGSRHSGFGMYAISSCITTHDNSGFGYGAGWTSTGSRNTYWGAYAGSHNNVGDDNVIGGYKAASKFAAYTGHDHVIIGSEAAYTMGTIDACIIIGRYSGYYNATSNRLIFDNQQRANAATEVTNSIIHGDMAALPANQNLRLNAMVYVSEDLSVGKATFETHRTIFSIIQVGGNAVITASTAEGAAKSLNISQNAYLNEADALWKAISTDESSTIRQFNGVITLRVSNGSDAADATVDFIDPFTIQNDGSMDISTYQIGYDGSVGGLSFNSSNQAAFAVGVGVAPIVSIGKAIFESWHTDYSVLQIGGNSTLAASTAEGASKHLLICQNAYYDVNNTRWEAISTDESSVYEQSSGEHIFNVSNGVDAADALINFIVGLRVTNTANVAMLDDKQLQFGTTHGTIEYISATKTFKIDHLGNDVNAEMILETSNACAPIILQPNGVATLRAENGVVSIGTTALGAKCHIVNADATTRPVLYLDQEDVSEEMIEFDTSVIGVGNAIEAVGGKTLTVTHFIKITITGVGVRYLQCGTIA